MKETLKELVLESATTKVTLRASDTDKGLEIDVKGLGQRMSIQRNGVEILAIDANGLISGLTLDCSGLPTTDPGVAGRLWIDPTGHVVVSAG